MKRARPGLAVLFATYAGCLAAETLAPVSSFDRIGDKDKRAPAIFQEAGKVIASPRCSSAIACPIPPAAPVTRATCPSCVVSRMAKRYS